jgi:hypothetical protein
MGREGESVKLVRIYFFVRDEQGWEAGVVTVLLIFQEASASRVAKSAPLVLGEGWGPKFLNAK